MTSPKFLALLGLLGWGLRKLAARAIAADLATVAPERVPGTPGDAAAARWMAEQLAAETGLSVGVVNARFAKPIDESLLVARFVAGLPHGRDFAALRREP